MPTDALDRLERLFRAARLHPPDERAAFLDAACDDGALRAEVEALLAADAAADDGDFLDAPATGLLGEIHAEPTDALVGRQVGPYRVLRPLGEGGMGAVYLAVRERPFLRHVALKVIRGGLATPDARARFEQERQILAGLDHVGIARLLDGGVTAPVPGAHDGLPYFAMEYVEGRPITAYCDEHQLGLDARLALFERVCDAVHTAHQNLVLHRDLKPSNILVAATGGPGGGPQVKLLDFGIAKLLNPNLGPAAAPVTQTTNRALTPEYASPEQVRGEPLSTASDVYSLGVVLYELLTGHRPHRLTRGSADEIVRAVVETDPERPSTAVTRVGGAASPGDVSAARDTTPEKLRRRLRGDLDAIVLKALRKEPARRYASAEALAQDLDRFRSGFPVLAHRGSRRYRLGKLVRRHAAETALAAVVAASVLGFAGYGAWQNARLETERDRAQTAQARAETTSAFLVSLFDRADPTAAPGDSLTVGALLDDGAARVEAELAGQPEVQAAVLDAVARAYQNYGRPAEAVPLLERALALRRQSLGDDHADTAASVLALADAYTAVHAYDRVEPLYREALAGAERRHGPRSVETAEALNRLVMYLDVLGRTDEAAPLARRWRSVLDHVETESAALAQSLTGLGAYLDRQGRGADAAAVLYRAVGVARRTEGDTSKAVGAALTELSVVQRRLGQLDEADATAREAVRVRRALYPEGHLELAQSLLTQGEAAYEQGRFSDALARFGEARDVGRRVYPDGHPSVAFTFVRLGTAARRAGRSDEAAAHYRAAIDAYTALFGADFPTVAAIRDTLALVEGG